MRLILPLLAAAAYMLYRSRSPGRTMMSTGGTWSPTDSTSNTDTDSPNAAERLKTSHAGGSFAGLGADRGAPEPKLRADSDRDGITPGMPDLMRGA